MTLDERARGRNNNLNLIRLIAAWTVLTSHSFVLATGDIHAEPWQSLLGTTPGGIAVDVFFVISGFLVTASLLRSQSLTDFAVARILRVYPGLWVAVIWTVLTVGLWFSDIPFSSYLGESQTWKYLLKNSVMITGAEADLPGAFAENIAASAVNGSLWTLRHELRLYVLLAIGWLAIAIMARENLQAWMKRTTIATTILLVGYCIYSAETARPVDVGKLAAMFFSGVAYQLFRTQIILSPKIFILASAAMLGAALHAPTTFAWAYYIFLPYLTLFIAYYISNPALLKFNRLGDYSYGIYIYAFPIQQMIMALRPGTSIAELTILATLVAAIFAITSWHCIEKPSLEKRRALSVKFAPLVAATRWRTTVPASIREKDLK